MVCGLLASTQQIIDGEEFMHVERSASAGLADARDMVTNFFSWVIVTLAIVLRTILTFSSVLKEEDPIIRCVDGPGGWQRLKQVAK